MKFKIAIYGVCLFCIVLFQTTILSFMSFNGVKPNILVVFVVSVALLRGSTEGAVIGVISGLIQDIMTGKIMGFYALLGLYLGICIGSVNKRLYRENFLVIIIFTFIATLVYEFLVFFFGIFAYNGSNAIYAISNIIIPEIIYNIVVSIFIYTITIKLNDKLQEDEKNLRRY